VQNLGSGWVGRVDLSPLTGTYDKVHAMTFKFPEGSVKVAKLFIFLFMARIVILVKFLIMHSAAVVIALTPS